jgi:ribosome biogenesis GTPase A
VVASVVFVNWLIFKLNPRTHANSLLLVNLKVKIKVYKIDKDDDTQGQTPMKFDFTGIKLNWFPGHMATSLKYMQNRLERDVELIVEVRDARIPYSSRNPLLAEAKKPRLIVFNKSDLTTKSSLKVLEKEGILTRKDHKKDLNRLFEAITESVSASPSSKHRVMILGIPNVGKSTLLNSLRLRGLGEGGKATATGFLPGVTKSVSGIIKICESPQIYLLDTPGILQPRLECPEIAMKIALCGGLYDKVVGGRLLSTFLLHVLEQSKNSAYKQFYGLKSGPGSIDEFLQGAADRIGARLRGGALDTERAAAFFLKQFRVGRFGPINLDLF